MTTDVLVIGGSAAGLTAATTAKSFYPEKSVTLVRKEENVMIPCGIPYIFGTVGTSDKNILPQAGLIQLGVEIKVDEVVELDPVKKSAHTKGGEEICFDKLILATGSMPSIPEWLKGTDLPNVFTIPKDKVYLDQLQKKLEQLKKVVVIGAGFIGVEVADEVNKKGHDVTVVEKLPSILGMAFDKELASAALEKLTARGVAVKTGVGIQKIIGEGKVTGVLLDNGESLEADAVILAMGYLPNSSLAKKAGLELNEYGYIKTDLYKRTSLPGIFAVGDCSEKRDFLTGKLSKTMLASPACSEGRVAGLNLYALDTVSTFRGTIGVYCTCIGDTAFGVAGLNETAAAAEGFHILTANFSGMDTHPGCFADSHQQFVKLIVSKSSGVILGGEAISGKSTGELMNVIGFAIQNKMTVNDLLVAQIGTHPMLTASPAGYPWAKAAEAAAKSLLYAAADKLV